MAESFGRWHEENGVIYLPPLVSDGTTAQEWLEALERGGHKIHDDVWQVLRDGKFAPTCGTIFNVAILKGMDSKLRKKKYEDPRVSEVRAEALRLKLAEPILEVGCLLCKYLTKSDMEGMGVDYIGVMHEPVWLGGIPAGQILTVSRITDWTDPPEEMTRFGAYFTRDAAAISGDDEGFAFVV